MYSWFWWQDFHVASFSRDWSSPSCRPASLVHGQPWRWRAPWGWAGGSATAGPWSLSGLPELWGACSSDKSQVCPTAKGSFGYTKVKFTSMTGPPGQHRIDGDEITQPSFFPQKVKWSFTTKWQKFSVMLPQQCLGLLAFFRFPWNNWFYEVIFFVSVLHWTVGH